jgi:hypothetical protein
MCQNVTDYKNVITFFLCLVCGKSLCHTAAFLSYTFKWKQAYCYLWWVFCFGYVILRLRPKGPVWNGDTKIYLHYEVENYTFCGQRYGQSLFFFVVGGLSLIFWQDNNPPTQLTILISLKKYIKASLLLKMTRSFSQKHVSPAWQLMYTHCLSEAWTSGGTAAPCI